METKKSISIMVTVSKDQRDLLKRVVAKKNLQDPDSNETMSGLSRQLIYNYLEQYKGLDNVVLNSG